MTIMAFAQRSWGKFQKLSVIIFYIPVAVGPVEGKGKIVPVLN
jgi:hypothetical protein